MRKKVLGVALASLALPALALAAQPMLIRIEGHMVPLHEGVQVVSTASGPVRVQTWSWRGPHGTATVQVSESRGPGAAMPAWALAQMRALQAQMQHMRLIEAALTQPLLAPSIAVPAAFGVPLLPLRMPAIEVRYGLPGIVLRAVPMRVIVIGPKAPAAAPAVRPHPHGHLV